jgi:hypothetical protein
MRMPNSHQIFVRFVVIGNKLRVNGNAGKDSSSKEIACFRVRPENTRNNTFVSVKC